tara:strand:+ start:60 stop:299 length:240 start_codon:yes stop_codon:yes gene_type:complete
MKIIDVTNIRRINGTEHATLILGSGFWLWKKKTPVEVCRPSIYWIFCDSGMFTDGNYVEYAIKAKNAKERLLGESQCEN